MFNEIINGVEVFEVGLVQLCDFLDGRLSDDRENKEHYYGDYLIVQTCVGFGKVMYMSILDDASTLESAVTACAEYQLLSLEHGVSGGLLVDEYEVWHVCDDGDLWQVWDHDATEYQRRMSGYYGIRCMACNDDCGPWVTVFTIGGGRGYLCEECFDRYNLINSFVGRIRLECL